MAGDNRVVIAARRLAPASRSQRFKQALASIESFKAQVGVTGISLDVTPATGRADSGDLETDLGELVEDVSAALVEDGLGFGLFIDEMQDLATSTLSTILAAQHLANQRDRPFYVIGAGLPSLPAVLSEARSYAEQLFDYRRIGPLPAPADAQALTEPITRLGGSLEPAALALLLDAAAGYPYFLQEYGQAIWDVAPATPFTVTVADAPAAGRWTQQDTIDAPLDPANGNRYTYAAGDPVNNLDPTGLITETCLETLGGGFFAQAALLGLLFTLGSLTTPLLIAVAIVGALGAIFTVTIVRDALENEDACGDLG